VNWSRFFGDGDYDCRAPAWPLHEGSERFTLHADPMLLPNTSMWQDYCDGQRALEQAAGNTKQAA